MLTVRGRRVLVQTEDQTLTERPSGIVTVEAYAPEVVGRVTACGEGLDVSVGDVVVFPPSAGQVLEYEGARYLMLYESELLAVVESA